jgi:hypothetical protein
MKKKDQERIHQRLQEGIKQNFLQKKEHKPEGDARENKVIQSIAQHL